MPGNLSKPSVVIVAIVISCILIDKMRFLNSATVFLTALTCVTSQLTGITTSPIVGDLAMNGSILGNYYN